MWPPKPATQKRLLAEAALGNEEPNSILSKPSMP